MSRCIGALEPVLGSRLDTVWLAYGRRPPGPPPRRWRGLVGYGRLDIAARVLLAALYPGGVLEKDSAFLVYLDSSEPLLLVFEPGCLPEGMLYEHESGEVLLQVLRGRQCRRAEPALPLPELLGLLRARGYRVLQLSEKGERLQNHRPGTVYLLGLRVDPPGGLPVDGYASVGPCSYLASHVAAYINALKRLAGRPSSSRP